MPATLHQIFEREAAQVSVSGNTPFLLDDPATVWLVQGGQVEVFSVAIGEAAGAGTRHHFFTAGQGRLLCGMDATVAGRKRALLAVGMVDTKLLRLPLVRFQELSRNLTHADEVTPLIDGWVVQLAAGLTRDIFQRVDLALGPGSTEIGSSQTFRAKQQVLWAGWPGGELLHVGLEEVSSAGPPMLFPVTTASWLQALAPARVELSETQKVIGSEAMWRGLELFYETILRSEAVNRRLAEVDDFNRLRERAEASQRAGARALEQLAGVLEPQSGKFESGASDPVFLACAEIGRADGIVMLPPPELKRGLPVGHPVEAIARASRVRSRTVFLKGQWWLEDGASMVGFLKNSQTPVALLALRPGEFELYDPANGTRRIVDAKVAGELEVAAHCFYRSFPEQALTLWRLVRFGTLGLKRDLWTLFAMGLLGGLLGTLPALAVGQVFGNIVPESEAGRLLELTLGLLVLAVTMGVFELVWSLAMLRIEGRMDYGVQAAVIDRLLKLPVPFFRRFSTGELAQRAEGINQIRKLVSGTVVAAIFADAFAAVNLGVLFYYSPWLALIASALIGCAFLFTLIVGYFQVNIQEAIAEKQGKITGLLLELLTGISKLRAAGVEALAFSQWSREFAEQKRQSFQARRAANYLLVFNAAFPVVAFAVLFYSVFAMKPKEPLPIGDFLAFIAAFTGFLTPMLALSWTVVYAMTIVPIYNRLRPILQAEPEDGGASLDPGALSGRVEFSHVTFRYGADLPIVLRDLSFEIRPGEFVAIVGPSGSGKSTLIRLLLGFNRPESGAIHLDGQDVAELDLAAVRRQIGVVLQASKLMPGDILSNISGSLHVTEEAAWQAARLAGLEADIRAMPQGMRTMIPAGGGVFSGGQIQRLMIARALVSRPRIVLFDEATSALDNRTQAIVSESLQALPATRIVIAHRLSTIIHADRILVMKDGELIQQGTYQDLLGQPGLFSELAKRQLIEAPPEAPVRNW